jgi:L,D-peptidoglycan transpeptidase YkuD (ErfK/YbiS/YcfS/YnhG family)
MLSSHHFLRRCLPWLSALLAISLAACTPSVMPDTAAMPWHDAQQLVLVTVADWDVDHGTLRTYERDGDNWLEAASPQPVEIGREGSAWGLGLHDAQPDGPTKREGDGRSPAGVFTIGEAFGYAAGAQTALPYAPMQASSYCIDVSDSPLYNRIVDTREVGEPAVAGSTEPMRRDLHDDGDLRYRLGFVIEHNLAATPGAGSCIFAHLWKSSTTATAGCTAMDDAVMESLLAWLRPERRPIFVLLPDAEYARLQASWGLPTVATAP